MMTTWFSPITCSSSSRSVKPGYSAAIITQNLGILVDQDSTLSVKECRLHFDCNVGRPNWRLKHGAAKWIRCCVQGACKCCCESFFQCRGFYFQYLGEIRNSVGVAQCTALDSFLIIAECQAGLMDSLVKYEPAACTGLRGEHGRILAVPAGFVTKALTIDVYEDCSMHDGGPPCESGTMDCQCRMALVGIEE